MHCLAEFDDNFTAFRPNAYSFVKNLVTAEIIKNTDKFAGVKIKRFIPLFKFIKLFKDLNRDNDIIILKMVDALAVMEDNIGVDNECFYFFRRHEKSFC